MAKGKGVYGPPLLLLLLVVGLPAAGVALAAGGDPSATPAGHKNPGAFCKAEPATILGTKGADTLKGTGGDDVIVGLGGSDKIKGKGGDDLICGSGGKDKVKGGGGADEIRGGGGDDALKGNGGDDDLRGNGGDDALNGGAATDRCNGGKGDDEAKKCELGPDGKDGTPVVNKPPAAADDSFTDADGDTNAIGNTTFRVGPLEGAGPEKHVEGSLLDNDSDPEGGPLTVVAVQGGGLTGATTDQGGVVDVSADGTFTYMPPVGFTGDDTFDYTVSDPGGADGSATVTVEVADLVWYVDSSASGSADAGTSAEPFIDLNDLNGTDADVDAPGETIFLYQGQSDGTAGNAYAGGLVLEAEQRLIGEPAGLELDDRVIVAPDPGLPDISIDITVSVVEPAVKLSDGVLVESVATAFSTSNGFEADGVSGFELRDATVRSAGSIAVDISELDGPADITGTLTVLDASSSGLRVTDSGALGDLNVESVDIDSARWGVIFEDNAGDITVGGGTIGNSNEQEVNIVRGSADVTIDADITHSSGSDSIAINGRTGGSISLGGSVTDTGRGIAIGTSSPNTGGEVTFDGPVDVDTGGFTALDFRDSAGFTTSFTDALTLDTTVAPAIRTRGSGGGGLNIAATPAEQSATATASEVVLAEAATTFDVALDSASGAGVNPADASLGFEEPSGTFSVDSGTLAPGADNAALGVSGGDATISYGGSVTAANGGRSVDIQGMTGGGVTVSGAIDDDSAGVFLDDNTGAEIAFSGGLDIDTGSNEGFTATGGGTVAVCADSACDGSGTGVTNSITTTTGTALRVADTTIGADGLNFRSISSDGSSSAIVLDSTGSAGGLSVHGNGGTCEDAGTCTGGVIEDTTGDGISLTDTADVSLTDLLIVETGRHGISGTGVDGFTFSGGVIDGVGDADLEHALNFSEDGAGELTGTVLVKDATITGMAKNGISVENLAGELDMTVRDSTFGDNVNTLCGGSSCEGSGIVARADGGQPQSNNPTINLSVANTTFDNIDLDGIALGAEQDGTVDFHGDGVSGINNSEADNLIDILADGGSSTAMEFTISDLTSDADHRGTVVSIEGNGSSSLDGKIFAQDLAINDIDGSAVGRGIDIDVDGVGQTGNPTARIKIEETRIQGTFLEAVNATLHGGRGPAARLHLVIDSVVGGPPLTSAPTSPVTAVAGATAGDAGSLCFDLANSSLVPGIQGDPLLIRQTAANNMSFLLPGYMGAPMDSGAIQDYIADRNVFVPFTGVDIGAGTVGFWSFPECLLPFVD